MIKKIVASSVIGIVIVVALAVAFSTGMEPQPEPSPESNRQMSSHSMQGQMHSDVMTDGDVIMPTKVSRPGCEEENRCYIPSMVTISAGESVTWVNQDSAFHSVTSGFYDTPIDLFDSGYMDPYDSYTLTFDETGTYDYFCTLHPWMEGQVIVE